MLCVGRVRDATHHPQLRKALLHSERLVEFQSLGFDRKKAEDDPHYNSPSPWRLVPWKGNIPSFHSEAAVVSTGRHTYIHGGYSDSDIQLWRYI